MEACIGGGLGTLKILFFFLLPIFTYGRYCKDRNCDEPISQGIVVRDFDSDNDNFIPVRKGDEINVIAKSENQKLYEVELGDLRGLVPRKYIKETRFFVQEENLLHILPDENDDDDILDEEPKEEATKENKKATVKSKKSKQKERHKLLQFLEDIEHGIQSTVKDTSKPEADEGPVVKKDSDETPSTESSNGHDSAAVSDKNPGKSSEDDGLEEEVGFKGAVTAPDGNGQETQLTDSKADSKPDSNDSLSAEEWLKNPRFVALRERQLNDYLKLHFTEAEATSDIRSLALEMITNDLLTKVNNKENELYHILRGAVPEEVESDKPSEEQKDSVHEDKDSRTLKSDHFPPEDKKTQEQDYTSKGTLEGDSTKMTENRKQPDNAMDTEDKRNKNVEDLPSNYIRDTAGDAHGNDFEVTGKPNKDTTKNTETVSEIKGNDEISESAQSKVEEKVRLNVEHRTDSDIDQDTQDYRSLTGDDVTENAQALDKNKQRDDSQDVVEERTVGNPDFVVSHGSTVPASGGDKPGLNKGKTEVNDDKHLPSPDTKVSEDSDERRTVDKNSVASKENAASDPLPEDAVSTEGQGRVDITKENDSDEQKRNEWLENVDADKGEKHSSDDNKKQNGELFRTLPSDIHTKTSDKDKFQATSDSDMSAEARDSSSDNTIAKAPEGQEYEATKFQDQPTREISPSQTQEAQRNTETASEVPTKSADVPEEEQNMETEVDEATEKDRLLALCHEHPHLEACSVLRGAKIFRGTKDMDIREKRPVPRESIFVYMFAAVCSWIGISLKAIITVVRVPCGLLGMDEVFDVLTEAIDKTYMLSVGSIVFLLLLYPVVIGPFIQLLANIQSRNKRVKMRSDCEKSYIKRAEIAAENCDKYRQELSDAKSSLQTERKERDATENELTVLKDKIEEMEKTLAEEKRIAEETATIHDAIGTLSSQSASLHNFAQKNHYDLQDALKEHERLKSLISKKEEEIIEADLMVTKHQKEIEDQKLTTNSLTTRLEEFQMELSLKDNEIENLQQTLGGAETEKINAEELKEKLADEMKNLETRLEETQKTIEEKERDTEDLEKQIEEKDRELEVLRGILLSINNGKNLDGETKENYEGLEDDADIQAEQLKTERLAKLMDTTSALAKVKELQEENSMLTEALGEEMETKRSIEVEHEKVKKELEHATELYKDFKAKAEASEIKLTTLREYFHTQESELHRKLTAHETARVVSEKKLDETLADSTLSIKESSMLREQLYDLKQEIKAVERSKQESENKKEKDYHDLYVKSRQCQRDLEEMLRERDYYRKRLLEREQIVTKKSPPQTRKAGSEGRASPRDSVDGGRAGSPQSQHSGKHSGMVPPVVGPVGTQFGPIPPHPMFTGMRPPMPTPYGPMPGPFHPGMVPRGMLPPNMMPRMPVVMSGQNTPPQGPSVPSGPPSMTVAPSGQVSGRPQLRQKLSDMSTASVQPSATQTLSTTLAPETTGSVQTPPTIYPQAQYARGVPRTSTPGNTNTNLGQGKPAAFATQGQPKLPPGPNYSQTAPFAPGQFSTPQGAFSAVNPQQQAYLNRTFPGGGQPSRDPNKENTLA